MLNRSASLAMSTSVLKALPGKFDIKRHSPSILFVPVLAGNINSNGGQIKEVHEYDVEVGTHNYLAKSVQMTYMYNHHEINKHAPKPSQSWHQINSHLFALFLQTENAIEKLPAGFNMQPRIGMNQSFI